MEMKDFDPNDYDPEAFGTIAPNESAIIFGNDGVARFLFPRGADKKLLQNEAAIHLLRTIHALQSKEIMERVDEEMDNLATETYRSKLN